MAIEQSGPGGIFMFEDFLGAEIPLTLTAHFYNLGQFQVTGLNIDNGAAGVPVLDSAGLNGVGRMTTYTTTQDSIFIRTAVVFDVTRMGTIVMECRIKSETLTDQQNWFGLANVSDPDDTIEDHIVDTNSGSTTIDNLRATMCGFLRTADLSASTEWHAIWNGGSATGPANSTAAELGVVMVGGEFQILRLEVDNNGTARWFIDGVLLKTLEGAASTSTDMAVILGLDNLAGSSLRESDVDYITVKANRDWTI